MQTIKGKIEKLKNVHIIDKVIKEKMRIVLKEKAGIMKEEN